MPLHPSGNCDQSQAEHGRCTPATRAAVRFRNRRRTGWDGPSAPLNRRRGQRIHLEPSMQPSRRWRSASSRSSESMVCSREPLRFSCDESRTRRCAGDEPLPTALSEQPELDAGWPRPAPPGGRTPGLGRSLRLRQEHDRPRCPSAPAPWQPMLRRSKPDGTRSTRPGAAGASIPARRVRRPGVPGPDDTTQSLDDSGGSPAGYPARAPAGHESIGTSPSRPNTAGTGGHRRRPLPRLSP